MTSYALLQHYKSALTRHTFQTNGGRAFLILKNFTDFTQADDDFNPICLRGKYWEFIREDIEDAVKDLGRTKN